MPTPKTTLPDGKTYVAEYLDAEGLNLGDSSWIAETIDEGGLIVCPCCLFLRLPVRPFRPNGMERRSGAVNSCDVCGQVPAEMQFGANVDIAEFIRNGADLLAEARTKRAVVLYALWIGATDGAEALLWSAMSRAAKAVQLACEEKGGAS